MRRSARWALGILGELLSNAKPGRRYAGPPITTNNGGRALVTGATGGIGEEVCRGLAARGYDVYVGARDASKGEAVAARLREEFPGAHKCLVCDLNGGDTALPRGVNLLVNNAGVMGAATDETMRVNLVAPARLTLGLRARNRKLRVVNVASSSVHKSNCRGASPPLLNHGLHAIDETAARWRGDVVYYRSTA